VCPAGKVPFAPSQFRDSLARKRVRHPDDSGIARASRREHDDDLYPCLASGWTGSAESTRSARVWSNTLMNAIHRAATREYFSILIWISTCVGVSVGSNRWAAWQLDRVEEDHGPRYTATALVLPRYRVRETTGYTGGSENSFFSRRCLRGLVHRSGGVSFDGPIEAHRAPSGNELVSGTSVNPSTTWASSGTGARVVPKRLGDVAGLRLFRWAIISSGSARLEATCGLDVVAGLVVSRCGAPSTSRITSAWSRRACRSVRSCRSGARLRPIVRRAT
jgi:hypothetical protein